MIGINVNSKHAPYARWIVEGIKTIETRDSGSLNPYVGQRVHVVETGLGPARVVGAVTIVKSDHVLPWRFDAYKRGHLVVRGSPFYPKPNKAKYLYHLIDAEVYGPEKQFTIGRGIVARKVTEYA